MEGGVDVSVDVAIRVIFSERIDTNKVTPATFGISPSVPGSFVFNDDTVTYNPSTGLEFQTEYTVSVTTGITDLAGNALQNNKSWSFTTAVNPATTPPVVISTVPANSTFNVVATDPISATFSKTMDAATLTSASFSLSGGVTGTVSYTDSTAVLTPDDTLDFNTQYTATLTTTVADTFGNQLAAPYVFGFTTGDDPMIPTTWIWSPADLIIIGDTVTIKVLTDHPVGVTKVEFYIDGQHVIGADDLTAPFEFFWDASSESLGRERTIYARAYEAGGRVGQSDPIKLFHQWEEIITDGNDLWATDIRRIMARSTDTTIEFRYEFWEPWYDPYDTIPDDTTLDLGIYIDTDQNASTGDITIFDPPFDKPLNGIGADYRVIVGIHGWESALARWTGAWQTVFDYTGLQYLNLPPYETGLEFGLKWSDLGDPQAINLVSINIFFQSPIDFLPDWVPDEGSGYVTIRRENRYVGEGYIESSSRRPQDTHQATAASNNPFE